MKRNILLFMIILLGAGLNYAVAQDENEVFTVVEEVPSFPGGDDARMQYIQENIVYPKLAKDSGIQGTVFVTFVVEKDGEITNVKILRGIGGGCDEECLRVVREMPKWIPGKQKGEPVRVRFNMPIRFKLDNEKGFFGRLWESIFG